MQRHKHKQDLTQAQVDHDQALEVHEKERTLAYIALNEAKDRLVARSTAQQKRHDAEFAAQTLLHEAELAAQQKRHEAGLAAQQLHSMIRRTGSISA